MTASSGPRPVPGPHLFRREPRWVLSTHALERAEELGFSPEEVLEALRNPEVSYGTDSDHPHPDARTYQRGDLAVVADTRLRRVVTVLLRTEERWEHGSDTRASLVRD